MLILIVNIAEYDHVDEDIATNWGLAHFIWSLLVINKMEFSYYDPQSQSVSCYYGIIRGNIQI